MNRKIPAEIEKVFQSYPDRARSRLTEIRQLIYTRASADPEVGKITETLKWGEPAYLTEQTGSGSTIRLGYKDSKPDSVAIYFNCQTTIIKDISKRYSDTFNCEDNRALWISLDNPLPTDQLADCIDIALKYHLNKKARKAGLM